MSLDLARLVAHLELQSSQFQSELEKTNRKLLGFQRQSNTSLKSIEKDFQSFQRTLRVGFAGIGFGAVTTFIKDAANHGDELLRLSERMETTVESLSQLEYISKKADVEFKSLTSSLDTMRKNLGMAADDGGRAKQAIKDLGLDAKILVNLSLDGQLDAIADAMQGIANPTERTRIAMQLLGGAGADLIPIFSGGSAELRKFRKEADDLNLTLSTEGAKRLSEVDEAMKTLTSSTAALRDSFVVGLGPAIKEIADGFRTLLGGATEAEKLQTKLGFLKEERNSFLPFILQWKLVDGAGVVITPAEMDAEIERIQKRLEELQGFATTGGKEVKTPVDLSHLKEFVPNAGRLYGDAQGLSEFARSQERRAEDAAKAIEDAAEASATAYSRTMEDVMREADSGIRDLFDNSRDAIERDLDALSDKFSDTTTEMSEFAKSAAQNMQSSLAQFFLDPAETGFDGLLKSFVDTIRQMSAEIASAKLLEGLMGKDSTSGVLGGFLSGIFGAAGELQPYTVTGAGALRMATGTNFVPRDDFPALLHKGEAVIPARYNPDAMGGALRSGPAVVVNNHIDARGATTELIRVLPQILKDHADHVEYRIMDGIRRGRYQLR